MRQQCGFSEYGVVLYLSQAAHVVALALDLALVLVLVLVLPEGTPGAQSLLTAQAIRNVKLSAVH